MVGSHWVGWGPHSRVRCRPIPLGQTGNGPGAPAATATGRSMRQRRPPRKPLPPGCTAGANSRRFGIPDWVTGRRALAVCTTKTATPLPAPPLSDVAPEPALADPSPRGRSCRAGGLAHPPRRQDVSSRARRPKSSTTSTGQSRPLQQRHSNRLRSIGSVAAWTRSGQPPRHSPRLSCR
jgi:hypothetical protein